MPDILEDYLIVDLETSVQTNSKKKNATQDRQLNICA